MSTEKSSEDRTISPQELLDYFQARLSEEREREIEELIADSDEYAEMARRVRGLLTSALDTWTARAHANALQAAPVVAEQRRVWQERLARLQALMDDLIEGVVGVVKGTQERGAHLVTEGLASLLVSEPAWQFAPLTVGARGIQDAPVIHVAASGDVEAHVAVSSDQERGKQRITVRIDKVPRGQEPPRIKLVHIEGEDLVVVQTKQPEPPANAPDAPYLIAYFDARLSEDYFVVLTRPRAASTPG